MALAGPTANVPGYARRSGRAATVWENAQLQSEVVGLEWNVTVEQIPVVIAGTWRNETKPGMEERAGTFRFQDVHDKWALRVWKFLRARRDGDALGNSFPVFDLITKIADSGAPDSTRWQLEDVQLFEYSGGGSTDDQIIIREVPFTFRDDKPLHAFEYDTSGVVQVYEATS